MSESKPKVDIDARYRTMLILWFALMMSIVMYAFTIVVAVKQGAGQPAPPDSRILSFAFAAIGTFAAGISFVLRAKLLQSSVEKQDPRLVQSALIVGCALCEVPALLGVVARIILPGHEYLILFAISVIAMALHFPRRANLLAASYRDPSFGSAPSN